MNKEFPSIEWVNPLSLRVDPVLAGLFTINPTLEDKLIQRMKQIGFNPEEPIMVYDTPEGLTVVEGHTRLGAAKRAPNVTQVPIIRLSIKTLGEAILYTLARQRDRRSTGRLEIVNRMVRCTLNPHGTNKSSLVEVPDGTSTSTNHYPVRTLEQIAVELGVSLTSVKRAKRYYDDHVTPEYVEAIRAGKMTVYDLPDPDKVVDPLAKTSQKANVSGTRKKRLKISEFPEIKNFFDDTEREAFVDIAKAKGWTIGTIIFELAKERLEEMCLNGNLTFPEYWYKRS